MSQDPKGKGGTMLLASSPFAQPGAPQPPGPPGPPGAPPGAQPPPGAPYGAPQGAPPGAPYGAPQGAPPGGYGAPPQAGGWGAPPPDAGGGGWGGQPPGPPPGMAPPGPNYGPPPGGGFGAPPMGPGAPMAPMPGAAGSADTAPDYVPGEKSKLLGLDQNLSAAVGYIIGLISLLNIIMEPKEHRFLRFHAFQWLFMAILGGVLSTVVSIPAAIAATNSKLTELAFVSMGLSLLFIPFGLMWLFAAFKAFQGKAWKIPVVGGIAAKMAMK